VLNKIYKLKINLGLLISLLLIAILVFYSLNALLSFYAYKKSASPSIELTVENVHFFLRNELKKEWLRIIAPYPLRDEDSPLKTFHITVGQEELDTLNVNLPESGKDHYVNGYLKVSDDLKVKKIKLRYRGDTSLHWLYRQKSLRIKVDGDQLYDMHKSFNLVNTVTLDILMDIINYEIASNEGLIAPSFYPARVFINSEYAGVYMFLSQVDESLLRRHRLMPGSIYAGDSGADLNKDKVSDLWWNDIFWKKKAARNKELKKDRADIKYFIDSISKSNDISFFDVFNESFDKAKFYNFISMDTLFGSYHHDFVHNHKIYFDPYKGFFSPVAWDQRRWSPRSFKDTSNYLLVDKLKRNPIFEYERDLNTYRLFHKYDLNYIDEKLVEYENLQFRDLSSDIYRDTGVAVANERKRQFTAITFDMQEYQDSIKNLRKIYLKRRENLKKIFDDVTVEYIVENNNSYLKLVLYVGGNTAVGMERGNHEIYMDKNLNSLFDESFFIKKRIMLYPGRKREKGNEINLHSYGYGSDKLINVRQKYVFFIKGETFDINKLRITNALTGKEIKVKPLGDLVEQKPDSIHPWELPVSLPKEVLLEGDVNVNETMVFDKFTVVTIKPGAVFLMSENASLYFHGKVEALGTKEKPIKFIAKDLKKPWGVVAVQGKATTGSKFEYVEFENGSIDSRNLINYTSPFNIHDTDWFEVRHCKIGRNFVGDDAMHVAYAKGIIDSCEFYDARSDALDIDISDVTVTNNIFYKAGNDGLDIMTTTMSASNNVFIDAGDKGISVGEWSEAEITDSFFLRTGIGLEVKDKSSVNANNLVIAESKDKAINLYNKNKRYDEGGFLKAEAIYLLGNTKVKADKRSAIEIKHRVENTAPVLKKFKWYEKLQSTEYKKYVGDVEVKYAQ